MSAPVDYKAHELNLYSADNSQKFRVIPVSNDPEVGSCFELKTTDSKNAGNSGVYVEYLMTNTNYGKLGVGLTLGQLKDRATALETGVANEAYARSIADAALQVNINSEAATRLAQDNAHTASIVQEVSDRTTSDFQITTALNVERSRALASEQVLTNSTAQLGLDLVAEAKLAREEEAKLNARVLLEIQTRGDSVFNESNLRIAADDVLSGRCTVLTAGVEAEVAERKSEIKRMDGRVDFITANVDPAGLDSLSEIVANFNVNGASCASRLSWLEAVVQELVNKSQ